MLFAKRRHSRETCPRLRSGSGNPVARLFGFIRVPKVYLSLDNGATFKLVAKNLPNTGSQPFEAGILNPPEACSPCHGNYNSAVEPYYIWQGSMMSQASRDLLFKANMAIANQDAPDSGDLCLRCHLPRGWLQGRSVPTDGSQMLPTTDNSGISCDFCHRLVDPQFNPAENPAEDQDILNIL